MRPSRAVCWIGKRRFGLAVTDMGQGSGIAGFVRYPAKVGFGARTLCVCFRLGFRLFGLLGLGRCFRFLRAHEFPLGDHRLVDQMLLGWVLRLIRVMEAGVDTVIVVLLFAPYDNGFGAQSVAQRVHGSQLGGLCPPTSAKWVDVTRGRGGDTATRRSLWGDCGMPFAIRLAIAADWRGVPFPRYVTETSAHDSAARRR
jgi:hypothetical protein